MKKYNEIVHMERTCIAYGTFDSVHRGHLRLAGELSAQGKKKGLTSVLVVLSGEDKVLTTEQEKEYFRKISVDMEEYVATDAIGVLSEILFRYYGKKVIVLLDEYDTPMQEAYVNGYWEEIVSFTRSLFNATFKNICSMILLSVETKADLLSFR